jgi:hypothetical protein
MIRLSVPPSIVSQDKARLVDFVQLNAPCIIKAMGDVPLLSRNGTTTLGSFAAPLDVAVLLQGIWDTSCPVFLQKQVVKDADIRVTVVDKKIFAALLHQPNSHDAQCIDFRNAIEVQTSPYQFPECEGRVLIEFLDRLGLRYASCDFCLEDNKYWFLEANVAGNYLWTELEANLQITQAVVNGLQGFN